MRAVGYVRVSTEKQATIGVSLEAQREKIRLYSDLKDFELINIISDDGLSGKNLNRPGVQAILGIARRKEAGAVIILKLDRMFRDTVDALQTAKELDRLGVSLHSISESLDTKSAMGRFFFTLTASLSELERNLIAERTVMALAHKKAKGQRVGHIPFGSRLAADGVHLEQDEKEQWILREIRVMRDQGRSLRKIADELNERRVCNRGNRWNHVAVKRVAKI